MPKKQRRLALFSALSAKYQEGKILALDEYAEKDTKTKKVAALLEKLPIKKDVLIVLGAKNDVLQKSGRNIPYAKTVLVNYINIADLQKYDHVLFLEEALKKMEDIYLTKNE